MSDQPSLATVPSGDIKQGLRIQSDLLANVVQTLREELGDLTSVPLRGKPLGGILLPGIPPIVQDKGCRIVAPVPELDDELDLDRALVLLRVLLQLPWAVLSGLPDDHAFSLPAVIEPLGLASSPPAGKALG